LNIDKDIVCESRDMSDESGTFVEYNSSKVQYGILNIFLPN
jgi:hypothetical protein